MEREDLGLYAREHRRLVRLPVAVIRLLLAIERRPPLRRRVIRALAASPELFGRLLAVHSRQLPVRRLGAGTVVRLGWLLVHPGRA